MLHRGVDLSAFQEATTRLDFSQEPALSSGSVAAILARTVPRFRMALGLLWATKDDGFVAVYSCFTLSLNGKRYSPQAV